MPPNSEPHSSIPKESARSPTRSTATRLAVLAHVRSPASHHHLHDRRAAARARLALAPVHLEAILKGAPDTVDVAEVVDRRSPRLDTGFKRPDDGLTQALVLICA